MANRKSITVNLFLLLAGAITWWLAETLYPTEEPGSPPQTKGPVDYYSEHVRRIEYDAAGQPKRFLVSAQMTHYQKDDRTEMDRPVMTLLQKDGSPPWIIDSDKAVTLSGSDIVLLQGNVLISKENEKGDKLKIITSNVKYSPPKNFAETGEDVLMLTSHDEVSGTGMEAQLEPHLLLKILANVRRKHDPQ